MPRLAPSKNVVLLAGVLLLGVAARMYGERAYASATRFDFRLPQTTDDAETWMKIFLAALAGSLIGSALGYRLNRASAAIMGPVGAAVATAHFSSLLGGILGAPVGLLVAWLGPRRVLIVAFASLAAIVVGVCGGAAAGAISIGPVEPVALVTTMLLVIGVVSALNLFVVKRFSGSGEAEHWRRNLGCSMLVLTTAAIAICGIPIGITLESLFWLRSIGAARDMELRPLDGRCFTHGVGHLWMWNVPPGFRLDDLRKLRRFDGIRNIRFGDADDQSLDLIADWAGLQFLGLSETHVSDRGIERLAALRWLQMLDLSGTHISGETFARLPPSLTNLWLARTAVTDESLEHLSKSPLLCLVLTDTRIGDAGVANLAGLSRLVFVDLSGTQVTDVALASLARSNPALTHLALRGTRVTSAGLAHLASLTKLSTLELNGCAIGDDAVPALIACRSLRTLQLTGTQITPAGVARLRKALPSCLVECAN